MDERQEFALILHLAIRGSTFTRLSSFPMQVKSVHLLPPQLFNKFKFDCAGVSNTLTKLLPENVARKLPMWSVLSDSKPAIGLLSIFIGMKGTDKELGLTAQNLFSMKSNDMEKVT